MYEQFRCDRLRKFWTANLDKISKSIEMSLVGRSHGFQLIGVFGFVIGWYAYKKSVQEEWDRFWIIILNSYGLANVGKE